MINLKEIKTTLGGSDCDIYYRPGSPYPWIFIKGSFTTHAKTFMILMDKLKRTPETIADWDRIVDNVALELDNLVAGFVHRMDILEGILIVNIRASKSAIDSKGQKAIAHAEEILLKGGFTSKEIHG